MPFPYSYITTCCLTLCQVWPWVGKGALHFSLLLPSAGDRHFLSSLPFSAVAGPVADILEQHLSISPQQVLLPPTFSPGTSVTLVSFLSPYNSSTLIVEESTSLGEGTCISKSLSHQHISGLYSVPPSSHPDSSIYNSWLLPPIPHPVIMPPKLQRLQQRKKHKVLL